MTPADHRDRAMLAPLAALLLLLAQPAQAAEELTEDEKFVYVNCGRCHVITPKRRMGGIGSTPSFMVIRGWDGWEEKMKAFWTLNPHPAFTQIEGVTQPFPRNRPSPIHPIELTLDQVERILAYTRQLPAADLGQGVEAR